jgi:hypothetical protein
VSFSDVFLLRFARINEVLRYFTTAKLNEEVGRLKEALRCAEEGLRIDRDCLGDDHVLHERNLEVIQALEKRMYSK